VMLVEGSEGICLVSEYDRVVSEHTHTTHNTEHSCLNNNDNKKNSVKKLVMWNISFPYLVVSLVLVIGFSTQAYIQVNPSTQFFVDQHNRTRIFHGVNAVVKVYPFHPILDRFDSNRSLCEQDMKNLRDWGFNCIRLYLAWTGFEPQRGQYNFTYLDQLKKIVDTAAKYDIYVILDVHQDVLSRRFCGEGFPDWATLSSNWKNFPFPLPFSLDRDTQGIPLISSCLQHPFFQYYFSEPVNEAFQAFYENQDGIRTSFAKMWQQAARYFANVTNVLAYEILNEPWVGNIFVDPTLLLPFGKGDKQNLVPLYTEVNNYIRKADNNHIIMFEPMTSDFQIIGFDHGPSGQREYLNREVFSYHIYCAYLDSHGDPKSKFFCELFDDTWFRWRYETVKRLGTGGFLTEFGAASGSRAAADELEWMTSEADKFLQSWAYWQFKFYDDITTQSSPPTIESFYENDGSLQERKVKALSRTYAHAICGVPTNMLFDPASSHFSLSYIAGPCNGQATIVYLNEKWYYTNGFVVSAVTKSGAKVTYERVAPNYLHFIHSNQVLTGDQVDIVINRS